MSKRDKVTLTLFIFVTLTAGFFGYLIDQVITGQPEGETLGLTVWFLLPLLTGIVLHIINKDLNQIGIRPNLKNNVKWYGVAIIVFPCIMLISIIIATATGSLTVGEVELSSLVTMVITSFLINCVRNIVEEFSWRGCLVPFLEKTKWNDWSIYFITGLIWGMWHIPYYMFYSPDEFYIETSRPTMVVVGIVLMIFWSPLFVEMRRLTNSVWPCLIMHAAEDAVPTLLFVTANIFHIKKEYSIMLDPISGIIPTILLVFTGLMLRKYRIKKEREAKK